ncbi:unnamed protein product [Coffea canephora]|uniref:E3 ubiquitin-protein ligase RNF123/RKP TPR repeat domain-containing protein n=1 Tax=Coffea canephora TaxID=49390 RepID=A0A068TZI3_COFCA|nr:unnamed protein product [Coffea canephora]
MKQGLASFVTFAVTHFNDPRISSAELKDLLLQSISVLVQYKEFIAVFERNEAAIQRMPKALLSAFDNRSWVPVTNILVQLCKGSGFGSSKHVEVFFYFLQKLLLDACVQDEELFSAFLNCLFNTLSWSMTEFSVSIREMQENYQFLGKELNIWINLLSIFSFICILDILQRKCSVIFDLSCNPARVLEFCTREIPQAFLSGVDTNLRRLTELIVFIINQLTSSVDPEFLDLSIRRPSPEKVNGGMILGPLAGIILNLLDASQEADCGDHNDIVNIFASMDCAETVLHGFYLLEYNWAGLVKGVDDISKLKQLETLSSLLICQKESQEFEMMVCAEESNSDNNICCICYACEANAQFVPCSHSPCFGCKTRHVLNCQRYFFCNATVTEAVRTEAEAANIA